MSIKISIFLSNYGKLHVIKYQPAPDSILVNVIGDCICIQV